jgi:hypothetical protein
MVEPRGTERVPPKFNKISAFGDVGRTLYASFVYQPQLIWPSRPNVRSCCVRV